MLSGTVKDRKGRRPGFDAADEKVAVCGKKAARKTAAQWALESRGEIIGAGGVMGIQMARRENRGLDGAVRGKQEPFIFQEWQSSGFGRRSHAGADRTELFNSLAFQLRTQRKMLLYCNFWGGAGRG